MVRVVAVEGEVGRDRALGEGLGCVRAVIPAFILNVGVLMKRLGGRRRDVLGMDYEPP